MCRLRVFICRCLICRSVTSVLLRGVAALVPLPPALPCSVSLPCPVLSCPVLSFPVLTCTVLSGAVLSCSVPSRPVPPRPVPSHPILSHPAASCGAPFRPVLFRPVPSCLGLFCCVLSFSDMACHVRWYPAGLLLLPCIRREKWRRGRRRQRW